MILILLMLILKLFQRKEFISAVINGGYPEVYELPIKTKRLGMIFYIKARITKDI